MAKAPDDKMVSMKLVRAVISKRILELATEIRHAEKKYREALKEQRKARDAMIAARAKVEAIEEMEQRERREAVEAGHAEYVITDPATGAVEFRWREADHAAR